MRLGSVVAWLSSMVWSFASFATFAPFATSTVQASVMVGSTPNPNDADLVLWLRADALALPDGSPVRAWPDASARRLDLSLAADGAAPLLSANRLNGLPGVQFNGGAAVLATTRPIALAREHTIVIVAQGRSTLDNHADTLLAYCDPARLSAADGCEMALSIQRLHGRRRLRSRYPGADAWEPAAPPVLAALSGAAILAQARVSGNAVRSYVMDPSRPVLRAEAGAWPPRSAPAALVVGGPNDPLTGDVFEVLVYDRALGPLELREVFDYLTRKWFPDAPAAPRVVLQAARSGGGFETFGADARENDAGVLRISPRSSAHSPEVFYRDRGASNFDLLDGALEFEVRTHLPSSRWGAAPLRLLELDGGAGGLSLALGTGGPNALRLELGDNERPIVRIAAAAVAFAADSAYRIVATFETDRQSGRVTARLYAAPLGVALDSSAPTFELARATGTAALDPAADNALHHAFHAADSFELGGAPAWSIEQFRVWSGVPASFVPRLSLPPPEALVRPEPEPALPSDFEAFAPPLSAAGPKRAAPRLAEWTHSGTAGDSLALSGEDLSAYAGRDAGKDTAFLVFGESAEAFAIAPAAILRQQGRRAMIQLDRALPTSTVYFIWPKNAHGYGRPIAVNRSEAWWLGPARATRGQIVSLYGRNLSHAAGSGDAYVYVKPQGALPGQWLTPQRVNPYKVDFALPADLADGAYEVWSHNGHGAHFGWSGPLALTVDAGIVWDGPSFDVRPSGDAHTDDAAIHAAIDAANRSGARATVRFSAGTFAVQRTLWLRSNVRLLGAGKTATRLRGEGRLDSHALVFFDHSETNEIAELSLDFGTALPFQGGDGFVITGDARALRMHDVRLQALSGKQMLMYIQLADARFRDCDFVGPQVALLRSAQISFERCNFYGTRDSTLLLLANGVRELSVTDCTGQDYDTSAAAPPDGWSQGRFINIVNGPRISRDAYLGENTTLGLGVNPNFDNQNTGEQICWDEAQGQFIDTARASANLARADEGSVTFGRPVPPLNDDRSLIAVVVAGTGEGQFRDVIAVADKQITVSPRWNVVPDRTSRLALGSFHERAVLYRNNLDGKAAQGQLSAHTSAAAIEPYGGVLDLTCDTNSVTDCRHGVYVMGHALDTPAAAIPMQPSLFHLYTNNAIRSSRQGVLVTASSNVASELGGFGFMFRGNLIESALVNAVTLVYGDQGHNLDMVMFDRTVGSDTPVGFSLNYNGHPSVSTGSLLLLDNRLERGAGQTRDPREARVISVAADHALATDVWRQGNAFAGFAPSGAASASASAPEIPLRQLAASARAGGRPVELSFVVYNVGAEAMAYPVRVEAAARWLTAGATGQIASGAAARYELTCDPVNLRPGDYRATVYVGNDNEIVRALSVTLTVVP